MGLKKDIKRYLKKNLDHDRYVHTLNVRRTARKLAKRHIRFNSAGERRRFLRKVSLAALLHDADKGRDPAELWARLRRDPKVDHRRIRAFQEIWHAFAAALTARRAFGLADRDLLNALRYHTTGRAGMSPLEKIIYLADYIEPGRRFPGVDRIRREAAKSLDRGCLAAFEHSIAYLQKRGSRISDYTLEARKDLLNHGIKR